MAKVIATIQEIFRLSDFYGHDSPSVVATCTRCEKTTESRGKSPASIRRCLVLLREGCWRVEHNYYVVGEKM
jgi:hypothetical protein